jgi:hypothetical protein
MNRCGLLIVVATGVVLFGTSVTVYAQQQNAPIGAVSSTSPSTPSINSPPTPPSPPPGPTWEPVQREQYREGLEAYRLKLEDFRQGDPTNNMIDYRQGFDLYREGIKNYRDNNRGSQSDFPKGGK